MACTLLAAGMAGHPFRGIRRAPGPYRDPVGRSRQTQLTPPRRPGIPPNRTLGCSLAPVSPRPVAPVRARPQLRPGPGSASRRAHPALTPHTTATTSAHSPAETPSDPPGSCAREESCLHASSAHTADTSTTSPPLPASGSPCARCRRGRP